jgi:hypothetical protein
MKRFFALCLFFPRAAALPKFERRRRPGADKQLERADRLANNLDIFAMIRLVA